MKHILFATIFAMTAAAPPAAALSQKDVRACKAMTERVTEGKAEIADLRARRDSLAESAETAGANWEEAEVHRNISARHGAAADQAKAQWEAAQAELAEAETALQARIAEVNKTSARFNERCAADE